MEPRNCDFGLSKVLQEGISSGLTTSTAHTGTARYLATELVDSDEITAPTLRTDIWALGCVGLKFVFSLDPYSSRPHNAQGQIFEDIRKGIPPAIFSEDLDWEYYHMARLIENCWHKTPSRRPDILGFLRQMAESFKGLPSRHFSKEFDIPGHLQHNPEEITTQVQLGGPSMTYFPPDYLVEPGAILDNKMTEVFNTQVSNQGVSSYSSDPYARSSVEPNSESLMRRGDLIRRLFPWTEVNEDAGFNLYTSGRTPSPPWQTVGVPPNRTPTPPWLRGTHAPDTTQGDSQDAHGQGYGPHASDTGLQASSTNRYAALATHADRASLSTSESECDLIEYFEWVGDTEASNEELSTGVVQRKRKRSNTNNEQFPAHTARPSIKAGEHRAKNRPIKRA